MARTFNGTSDYGSVAINLSAYSKVTIACWGWWDAYANNDEIMLEYTPDFNTNNGFFVSPNSVAGSQFGLYVRSAIGYNGGTFVRPSAGAWHHYVFTFDRNGGTACQATAFVDGSAVVVTQGSFAAVVGNFDNSSLYVMSRAGTSLFGAGRIADLALWGGVLLGATEAQLLFAGNAFPNDLSRDNLMGYWPMCGVETPEQDQSQSNADMTIGGTTRSKHFRGNQLCFVSTPFIPLSVFE